MEAFVKCFMDKNKGKMDKKCIQELKELLPEDAGQTLVSARDNYYFFLWLDSMLLVIS